MKFKLPAITFVVGMLVYLGTVDPLLACDCSCTTTSICSGVFV